MEANNQRKLPIPCGFCGIYPCSTEIECLKRGDYERIDNLYIALFRDDWHKHQWDEYNAVEMMVGFK